MNEVTKICVRGCGLETDHMKRKYSHGTEYECTECGQRVTFGV